MSQFDLGKKIFFLYPPVNFSKTILHALFKEGFEIYTLNSTDKILSLLQTFPDSLFFVNSDYPYKDIDFQDFFDNTLSGDIFKKLQVYSFFSESVTYGSKIKDYISLDQPQEQLIQVFRDILDQSSAHGKREHVRFGSYNEVISPFIFECGGTQYTADLHDISPKAFSFSIEDDLDSFLGQPLENIKLVVGAYEIHVSGVLSQKRSFDEKKLYIALFEGENYQEDLFNFIYTSLEKKMDELIQSLKNGSRGK